ncbi:ParB N-terminal domain-containing protein [Desulfobacula sp.]
MKDDFVTIPIPDIYLDESIYPRENIDQKRIGIFVENLRDGFKFDPIEVQSCPGQKGRYRILDGVHRWSAYKKAGLTEVYAIVRILNQMDPLLYAAKLAIGPRQLTEAETRNTARRVYENNSRLTSIEIGQAIGRSRQAVDRYIADLRAVTLLALDLKMFHLNQLGIPQDRIAKRLDIPQRTLSDHSAEMPRWAFPLNSDLVKGLTVPQVAEKHGWPEPLVWSLALKGKDDQSRFEALNWNLIPWDVWEFNEDTRFGDQGMDRIPSQVIANILYFFSNQNDLIFDPMSASSMCADTCLALERRCWSLDMKDRPDTKPEIEPYHWNLEGKWEDMPILFSREKPDLIICEPPWFEKNAQGDAKKSISGLSKKEYLGFLEKFFLFLKKKSKKKTRLAFIGRDFQDYENCPAVKEDPDKAILIYDYYKSLQKAGWALTHIIQTPLSSDRFDAEMVEEMQEKRILGTTGRYVLMMV